MSRGPARLRQTHSYLWSEEDALGRGAAGQVYVAYCKSANPVNHKGEKVAAKVCTEHRSMQRATEALKRLTKHKNIVTFYGTEQEGYNTVLIMELCNAGSLYEVIESPEHSHGLDEEQFKTVLIDIAEGLHHLRQLNFAHRDIKPSHIMRCQLSDGSYRFKLADFGTARNIDPEDEAPKSLVGTVEYLHPNIYDSYLKHHQRSRYKSSEADLWSLGATYYHAATGMVPFRAFRSRGDDQTMVRIIKDKPSGAVTGWQERDGGPIKYSNQLPRATLISQGLKDLITPLIAGLLEVNTDKAWKFDKFFHEVKRITEMKVVDVFCISHCSCHKIYIDRKLPDGVQRLKDSFRAQTRLNPRHTELFYENLPYAHGANPIPVDRLPQTTPYKPIIFLGGEPQKADRLEQPPLLNHNFPHSDDIVRYAKECLKTLWGFQYSSEMLDYCFQMMHQSAHCLSETIHQEYTIIAQQADSLTKFHEVLCWILRNQESQLVNDIALLDLHKITNERGCGDLLHRMQNKLSQKRDRIKMYEGRRESILSHLREAHAQTNGIRVQWDSKLHTEIFSESVEKVAFFVQTVKKLLSEAESLQRKFTSREHNQLITEHISSQLPNTYTTGQEKILEMQEIRSNVHNKLYVFLNNCHALREEMSTFRRDLENDEADCKNDMKRLQETTVSGDSQALQQIAHQKTQDISRLEEQVAHLGETNRRLQEDNGHRQREVIRLQEEVRQLQSSVEQQPKLGTDSDISFWLVSHDEVRTTGQVLGIGGWGSVTVGSFRGKKVAIKELHSSIRSPYYDVLLRREISLMAKVRHPNLLLFIAAVLDIPNRSDPIIVTELLDTDLRKAYQNNQLANNRIRLFILRDVAAALNYLHLQREPIIHRDVSSANVLLQALPDNRWRGKLSDFGSANIVQYASTPGPGNRQYMAPEVLKEEKQSTKMDVYSYGKLFCEVFTSQFPDQLAFPSMLQSLARSWPLMHKIIIRCVEHDPVNRPTMSSIVDQLNIFTQ